MKKLLIIILIYVLIKPFPIYADSKVKKELVKISKRVYEADLRAERIRLFNQRVQGVKGFLANYRSSLGESAKAFVECGERYGIDYRLLVAISGKESTFGKFIPPGSFNPFGWDIHNGRTFDSFDDAICTVAKGLSENYRGYNLGEIAYKYAPPIENDTEKWIADVKNFMSKL